MIPMTSTFFCTQMASLAEHISSALEQKTLDPALTIPNHQEVYWFYQELEKFLTGQTSLDRFLDRLQHGQEAVWRIEDPLPFLALNFIQIPLLLFKTIIFNTAWSKVNFCLGQVL